MESLVKVCVLSLLKEKCLITNAAYLDQGLPDVQYMETAAAVLNNKVKY